ncbi:MAG TPA: RdgB/HAM1 family non-canonical purine NTP pyrophosphatase [Steroidobacteraceae bacterium]|jgi:XTP/dITP diphosphohydrolase|nr:RdgB/HAM1 family non-canonical purine NTP pyrophosphatase [Steroidobacteraceae bacterium]
MSFPRSPLVVATANPGKLREFRALLGDFPFDLTSLAELGIESPEESGATFVANASIKARHAAARTGAAAIADDSGLEVDALGGAPGVFSARYAGPAADDAANNAKLVRSLAGIAADRRFARYRCALVLVTGAADPAPLVAEGVWEGMLLDAPRGSGGFGYDPYFWIPSLGVTAAELDPGLKNRLSHRGLAMRSLLEQLGRRAGA